ncbi:hypothetical protein OG909_23055 [Streptomyces sp. NBC_01754]|uniref:hypothetical protein n=1 Tax=Streptomyces sp. NBC_01754 TaxID=2975930 RepID=UPI002DD85FFB|nr:hypothetical protein [Streptomyces sp. NBC_01754]WSC94920.1 hypothetical protein OG909_23055 [Streptomyces sp. NBC_01754]
MRKTLTATAFVLAAVLLTGCGGDEGKSADEGKARTPAAEENAEPKETGGGAVEEGPSHEVTIKVEGTGRSTVMYTLDDSDFAKVDLPWTKTATIAARGAEREVGRLVIVTPGSMAAADGMLVGAGCSITVDGKTVVEKESGGKTESCSYKIK